MNNLLFMDIEKFCRTIEAPGIQKVAFVYHLKIGNQNGYKKWLNESKDKFGGRRLFRVKADPVSREGMLIDEVVIDKYSNSKFAVEFLSTFIESLKQVCTEYTILAIIPEPSGTFYLIKVISWFVRLFKGVNDKGIPTANWKAEDTSVWPDENQMEVARNQDLNEPLFVYNLNKYRPTADYKEAEKGSKEISGKEAYDRYSKIAGFELLRRGAYPVYGGKPICIFGNRADCMLADLWDHLIFVRYPQRRNLLATIESDEFHKGQVHRDAGLERVAIFMARKA